MNVAYRRPVVSFVGPGLALLIGVLLCANTLVYVESTVGLGRTSMVALLLTPGLLACSHVLLGGHALPGGFQAAAALLTFLCVLMAPRGDLSEEALVPFIQVALVTFFFAGASVLAWPHGALRVTARVASLWCLAMAACWLLGGRSVPYTAYFENPNACGGNLLFALAVSQLPPTPRGVFWRIGNGLFLLVTIGALTTTVSRSALLGLVVAVAVFVAWPLLRRNRTTHRMVFLVLVTGIAAFILGSTLVVEQLEENGFAELSNRLTGKNLGTREQVWRVIVDAIAEQPVWGYGAAIKPSDFTGVDLSAHCLYMQVAVAAGLIGVAALVAALAFIWDRYWVSGDDPVVRVAGATLAGLLVHQTFEVSLIQNHLAMGCLGWVVLGVGVSRTLQRQPDAKRR